MNRTGQDINGNTRSASDVDYAIGEDSNTSEAEPPSTPIRTAQVIIYTASKTWVPVNDDTHPPTLDAEDSSFPDTVEFGSPNADIDEVLVDSIEVPTQRARMKSSAISPYANDTCHTDGAESSTNKQRSAQSVGTPITFSKAEPFPPDDSEYTPAKQRDRDYSVSNASKSVEPVRDAKGRFASRSVSEVAVNPEQSMNVRRRSSSASQVKQPVLMRDSRGRFAKKVDKKAVSPDTQLSGQPLEDLEPDAEQAHGHIDKQSAEPTQIEEPGHEAKQGKITKAKTKRPPAKSPYFATPPITPSKSKISRASTSQIGEGPEAANSAILSTALNDIPSPSPKKRSPPGLVSCIPFPPLASATFGLIQEKLAHDPFRLLIAVTFLIRTHGKHAIPVYYSLMKKYPTPESLVATPKEDIIAVIQHLGLQNQRAATYQSYAKIWLENPPAKDKRYAVRDYPFKGAGRDIKKGEILDDLDPRSAWEIGHMTQGPYAIDSWRIFCRDVLRGVATGWNGEGNTEGDGFQPEWMRVLPEDKELRAYLRWMWLKEGFEWDPFTGEKEVASERLMKAAIEGRIAWDDRGGMRILDEAVEASVEDMQLL